MEGLLLPLLLMLIVAVPLVLGTRKQKKQVAQQQELQKSLAEGDKVMTTSGLYATVADASDETTIDLEVADGVVTTWLRQAVREKVDTSAPAVDEPEVDDAADTAEAGEAAATETVDTDADSTVTAESDTREEAAVAEQGKK